VTESNPKYPDRDARGRLLPGHTVHKPPGARNRLQASFIDALAEEFAVSGPGCIKIAVAERPIEFLKLIASILPREWLMTETSPLAELSDEDLLKVIAFARSNRAKVVT
jgi:hypothetical protein